ncbi:unnamed protein product [Closterium sp. Naga37s-1]|nr:unnamed protein product [Closterium sp. Naga37s-1]
MLAGNTAADTIVTGTGGKEVPFLLEGVLERSDLTSGRRFWSRGEGVSGLNGEIAVGVASIPVTVNKPGATASGAASGARSGAGSGAASGGSLAVVAGGASGATAGGFSGGSPGVATPSAGAASADPSAVAAFILTLQSAINGRPQPSTSAATRHLSTLRSDPSSSPALAPPAAAATAPAAAAGAAAAAAVPAAAAASDADATTTTPAAAAAAADVNAAAEKPGASVSYEPNRNTLETSQKASVSYEPIKNTLGGVNVTPSTVKGADMLLRSGSGNGWIMKCAYNEAFEPEAAECDIADPNAADVAQELLKGKARHGAGLAEECEEEAYGCDSRFAKRVRTEAESVTTFKTPRVSYREVLHGMLKSEVTNGWAMPVMPGIPRSSSRDSSTCSNAVACGGDDKEWNGMQMQGIEVGVLLEQRRRQQQAQEVQWEREKKLLLCVRQGRGEGREEGVKETRLQREHQLQHEGHHQQQQQQQQQHHQQLALHVVAALLLKHG